MFFVYTSMGRGRKGLIEQSQKKPKKTVQVNKEGNHWWTFHLAPYKNDSMFLSKDFLEALERMEPKEVADILLK